MKGVEQFQQALEISPQCVPAQYGLALGLLGLAKDCINLGAYQWGASLLEVCSIRIFVLMLIILILFLIKLKSSIRQHLGTLLN